MQNDKSSGINIEEHIFITSNSKKTQDEQLLDFSFKKLRNRIPFESKNLIFQSILVKLNPIDEKISSKDETTISIFEYLKKNITFLSKPVPALVLVIFFVLGTYLYTDIVQNISDKQHIESMRNLIQINNDLAGSNKLILNWSKDEFPKD